MEAATFEILAEPNRRRILDLLLEQEQPVGALVAVLGVSQPAVSKHLRILRDAGLVAVRADAQRRLYRVSAEPLRAIDDWLAPYRARWSARLDDLERHLDAMEDRTMDGQLERAGDRWQLTFVRSVPHPPEKVWRAVTEPEHLASWFPVDIEGERAAGASLRFVFRDGEGPEQPGELLAFDPPKLFEFTWGTEHFRLALAPDGTGTVLTFVNTFTELGTAARDAAGWHTCLDRLGFHLAGEPPPWGERERWEQVHGGYIEAFGPEAATIGPPGG